MPAVKYIHSPKPTGKEVKEAAKKQLDALAKLIRGECGTAAALSRIMKCSHERAARRLEKPEEITLGELIEICVELGVNCDEAKSKINW